jgi:hypothetical protein
MKEKEIKSKVKEGYIHVRAIIEVLGKPKDYVEKTLKNFIKKIKETSAIIVVKEDFSKAKSQDELFSAFADIEFLIKDASALIGFCFDYMPSSVEILDPEQIVYDSCDFTDYLNDLQGRLHALNMGIQELTEKNKNLVSNTSILLNNMVIYALKEQKTSAELSVIIGLQEDKVIEILTVLMKEGKIIKEGDRYKRK